MWLLIASAGQGAAGEVEVLARTPLSRFEPTEREVLALTCLPGRGDVFVFARRRGWPRSSALVSRIGGGARPLGDDLDRALAFQPIGGEPERAVTLECIAGELRLRAWSMPEGPLLWESGTASAPARLERLLTTDVEVLRTPDGSADALAASASFALAAPDQEAPGLVLVVCARDGSRRFMATCQDRCSSFGSALLASIDAAAGHQPVLLVGSPECGLLGSNGCVSVLSGIDGQVLARFTGGFGFGHALAALPDRDGDGRGEIAVGAPASHRVEVVAGGSWRPLATVEAPGGINGWLSEFGAAIATAPDLDGDGLYDYVVSAPGWSDGERPGRRQECGRLWLLGGRDDRILATWRGTRPFSQAGRALAVGTDAPDRASVFFSERGGVSAVELRSAP